MPSLAPLSLSQLVAVQSRLSQAELDLDNFMRLVVDTAESLTGAYCAVVELVEGEEMVYRCVGQFLSAFEGLRLPSNRSFSGLCVAERRVLRCDETETDPRVNLEACRRVGARSMACTPLVHRGVPVGVLKVMSSLPAAFDDLAVSALEVLAGLLGAALGRQLEYDALVRAQSELRRSEARARASEARTRALLRGASNAIMCMDEAGYVTEWNAAAERLFGWVAAEAVGQELAALILPPEGREQHREALGAFLNTGHSSLLEQRVELSVMDRDGRKLEAELSWGVIRHAHHWEFLGALQDISERKALETRLREMADEDGLTGLPNRRAFLPALERSIARAARHRHGFALLYLDLDGFKDINDRYGHAVGDRALCEFAERLRGCLRRADLLSRLGGDEFVILADGIDSDEKAGALAAKIRSTLAHRAVLVPSPEGDDVPPRSFDLRSSIGIVLHRPAVDASALLREADHAMYLDKRRRRAGRPAAPLENALAANSSADDQDSTGT